MRRLWLAARTALCVLAIVYFGIAVLRRTPTGGVRPAATINVHASKSVNMPDKIYGSAMPCKMPKANGQAT